MNEGREGHTATRLLDGRVLVAGGSSGDELATTAELYDPKSGVWTATGSMTEARSGHTATLLTDGRVLVAGGANSGDIELASAELWDPSSGTWAATGVMSQAHSRYTATLLADGTVLVAGGEAGVFVDSTGTEFPAISATAELYDPKSGVWTATGSMVEARYLHTATLLTDGRVLVAGGSGGGGPLASAEVYDPRSRSWTTTGSMNEGRFYFTATRLGDGKVLGAGPWASAELYDPVSGTWTATGNPLEAREAIDPGQIATVLLDGKVLVTGGYQDLGPPFASVDLYDPVSRTWTATAELIEARHSHTATLLLSGTVLVAGGANGNTPGTLASAELYDPGSES